MQHIAGVWLTMPAQQGSGTARDRCQAILQALGDSIPSRTLTSSQNAPVLGTVLLANGPRSADERPDRNPAARPSVSRLLVADLRLDNREELAGLLEIGHHELTSITDAALLSRAWDRWGDQCLAHLVGGFAFAVWDGRRQRLFLARDHSGEKPLFFADLPGLFAFASMPKGLQQLPEIGATLNQARMSRFLAVLPAEGTDTFFERIQRLPPGCFFQISAQAKELRRYWHPSDTPEIHYKRDEAYLEDFHERFGAAVGARLRGSAGIGSELSGGLDSASVTAIAAQRLAPEGRILTAYTAIPDPAYDGAAPPGRFGNERLAAAEVAALYRNIEHVCVGTAGQSMTATAECAAVLSDEPVFNPTNQIWVHAILENAKARGIGVLLQGVTGNATISFGGLPGLGDAFRSGHWLALAGQVKRLRARGYTSWRGAASWACAGFVPLSLRRVLQPGLHRDMLSHSVLRPALAEHFGLREAAFAEFYGGRGGSAAFRRRFFEYYDPGAANGAVARGWGIENRDPTQDKRVFEFCYAIPAEQYLKGDQTRSLVRRAMRGHLPASTLTRTTRGLQAADWYLVMGAQRAEMAAALTRIEQSPLAQHMLDLPRLRQLLDTWPSSGYEQIAVANVYHLALSRGLAAGLFIAQHDPDSASALPM